MKSTYFETGDVLRIRISENPVAQVALQDQHVHIGYAVDGTVVEVVLLEAKMQGWLPLRIKLPLPKPPSRLRQVLQRLAARAQ